MDVSVIIINYRTPHLISNCLETVYRFSQGFSFEIIIVDNDPAHGGREQVEARFPGVRWVEMHYNAGFGRANNEGMKIAQGKYFLLLNADTLLTFNVIGRCFDRMEAAPDVIACGALQLYPDGSPMPFYTSFNDFRKTFYIVPPGNLTGRFMNRLFPEPVYDDPEQHDWLVGAFMMVRREGYYRTGGFEESLFMYGEDVEWSWRLGKLGKLCYFKDCTFLHLENDNPFRRTRISWINRFSVQMQVSNMVWIRKQYGIVAYLLILLHYILMIPVVYIWRAAQNIAETGRPGGSFRTQYIFMRKVRVLLGYAGRTLNYRKHFFRIKPEENIDKLFA